MDMQHTILENAVYVHGMVLLSVECSRPKGDPNFCEDC